MDWPIRKSPRLQGFDYSQEGAYAITISSFQKRSIFGKISIGKLENTFHPSPFGHILRSTYLELPERFPDFDFLHFVVMPNHIHLLLLRHSNDQKYSLSGVIGAYKSLTAREARKLDPELKLWQKSFYDHIIRNNQDLENHWNYIEQNVNKWGEDRFFVE
jgi:REP element-mobilizing transposase RayT